MSNPDTFNIIFSSNTNAAFGKAVQIVNNTNINYYTYYVNWGSILPEKYKKFKCNFSFYSNTQTGTTTTIGNIGLNVKGKNIYLNDATFIDNIGVVYPVLLSTNTYYKANIIDNPSFEMNYPKDNLVTVNLCALGYTNPVSNPLFSVAFNYVLILTLQGIE